LAKRRYLVISDIHSNEEALSTVLRCVSRRRYDGVLCLGDVVGYGAGPNPVTLKIRNMKEIRIVRGNHDKAVADASSMHSFNNSAKTAAQWTKKQLSKANFNFISSLPKGPVEVEKGLLICHGSPLDEDYYLFSEFDAYQVFENAEFKVCFFGHTHYPCIFKQSPDGISFSYLRGESHEEVLDKNSRYLINPGSVGQPRDRNPFTSFAEYYPESRRFIFRRLSYDIEKAASKILKAGLPENLGARLRVGT
jgi:predicted phosphodiesterase